MPTIAGEHNGRAAYLTVGIVDAAASRVQDSANGSPLRGVRPYRALIDTGATTTMIAKRVVSELNLQMVNRIPCGHVNGESWLPGYLFNVCFYEKPPASPDEISRILRFRTVINGASLDHDPPTFDVLLGMDVLTTGQLIIDRRTFSFTFNNPPLSAAGSD